MGPAIFKDYDLFLKITNIYPNNYSIDLIRLHRGCLEVTKEGGLIKVKP
jgi:hypothetical protein